MWWARSANRAIISRSDRALPPLAQGDLIAIMTAGAYGAVQSGTYNSRPLVPEVLVKGRRFAIVRPRQTYEDLIGRDRLAAWQREISLISTFIERHFLAATMLLC